MRVRSALARVLVPPLAILGAIVSASPASADPTPIPLTGELLSSLTPAQTTSGSCDREGISTFTFTVSGIAAGPYPGTFTETGTVTLGPLDDEFLPGQFRGEILSFEAEFTITSALGTVTGTKELPLGAGQPVGPGNAGVCMQGTNGVTAQVVTNRLEYEAVTPFGTDSGSSFVGMNTYPGTVDPNIIPEFRQGFTSVPVVPECSNGVDDDGDGDVDFPADPGCESATDDSESPDPGPATVTLTPPDAVNPVGTSHTVTATVEDEAGNPVDDTTVLFSVEGSITTTGSCTTDADGQCSFTYQGPGLPGADAITACADSDGNAAADPGEPCASATKAWVIPATTAGQVTGGGQVANAAASDSVAFGFNARSDEKGVRGTCTVVDPATGVKIKCLNVTAVVQGGNHVTFFGDATVDDVPTTYRIDVQDNGEPGGTDTFTIQTASGYTAGGVVERGNVQVR